jgi:predicted SprT family Zn-dependent metalloprotease
MWPFHRHHWEPVSADVVNLPARGTSSIVFRRTATRVLYRCECGKTKTRTLEGVWTLKQIQQAPLSGVLKRISRG